MSLSNNGGGVMEVSQTAATTYEIAYLLIDRVTFKKYRCSQEECRKTFEDASDLYSHIASHVSKVFKSYMSVGGNKALLDNIHFSLIPCLLKRY
jgi:hypothetical protein